MKTVEWLNRANGLQTEIKELKETYWKGVEQNEEYPLSALQDYTDRIETLIDKKYQILSEITDVIQRVPEGHLQHLLFARYICGESWNQIAEEIRYCSFYVRKELHNKALKEVEKILVELKVIV